MQQMRDGELGLYRAVRSRVKAENAPFSHYQAEQQIFDWASDPRDLARLIADPDGLRPALAMAENVFRSNPHADDCGVYVIGVSGLPVSKIGISVSPLKRVRQLQVNHWADLTIHAVLWTKAEFANQVEKLALQAASEMGVRLRGEWVNMEPSEAAELVCKAGRYCDANAVDGQQWVKNISGRVEALRRKLAA